MRMSVFVVCLRLHTFIDLLDSFEIGLYNTQVFCQGDLFHHAVRDLLSADDDYAATAEDIFRHVHGVLPFGGNIVVHKLRKQEMRGDGVEKILDIIGIVYYLVVKRDLG